MIERVISGGQTGADLAGWQAAKDALIDTGGWMPKGFKNEDGYHPEYAEMYGAKAHPSASYRDRTISNVTLADGTICFVHNQNSAGSKLAHNTSLEVGLPFLFVVKGVTPGPNWLASWFPRNKVTTLNVAGNRESSAPGINAWVREYLAEVFRILNF